MVAPYLRTAETELDLWADTRLSAGDRWDKEIDGALKQAGVVVALVSADFLASKYVTENELPVIGAQQGAKRSCSYAGALLNWLVKQFGAEQCAD